MKIAFFILAALSSLNVRAQSFPVEQWISNNNEPTWAEVNAPKGGIFRGYITEFPPTFRIWGPYAHHPYRGLFSANQLSLITFHPNTNKPIPSLAESWFFHKKSNAITFRIHRDARWSDSTPVTASDFVFTKKFFTSGMAKDDWYQSFYLNNIETVKAIDSKTVYIQSTRPMKQRQLIKHLNLRPLPKHFYSNPTPNLIKVSQWRVEPNTGPYILSGYSFGDELIFRRKTEWWGKNLKYNQGRFNVDTVIYKVYKTRHAIRKAFTKGYIDYYRSTSSYQQAPLFKSLIERGAVHHFVYKHGDKQIFNGVLINTQSALLSEKQVRQALHHGLKIEQPDPRYRDINALLDRKGPIKHEYDPFTAKRLLTESGWLTHVDSKARVRNNTPLTLELVYDHRISSSVIETLRQSANNIGIEIKAFPLTPTQLQTYIVNKVFDLALLAFDAKYFDYKDLFNEQLAARPDNWSFYQTASNTKTDFDDSSVLEQHIADEYLVIPGHISDFSFGYHWRWLIFPKTPSTQNANHLYEPFGNGGLFWISREFLIETRTNRRARFQFEKAIQVFE